MTRSRSITRTGGARTQHSNFRLQAAAIIRREPFDGLILGTSMTENTSAEEAGRLFDERMANLSITASDFIERSLILDDIFRRRQIRHVIYTLDHVYIGTRKGYSLYPLPTFDFLYDRNPFNDVRAYLNQHFAQCLLTWSRDPDCVGTAVSLDRPNAWINQTEYAVRFGGIRNWCKAKDNYQIRDAYLQLRKAIDNKASGTEQSARLARRHQRRAGGGNHDRQRALTAAAEQPAGRAPFCRRQLRGTLGSGACQIKAKITTGSLTIRSLKEKTAELPVAKHTYA